MCATDGEVVPRDASSNAAACGTGRYRRRRIRDATGLLVPDAVAAAATQSDAPLSGRESVAPERPNATVVTTDLPGGNSGTAVVAGTHYKDCDLVVAVRLGGTALFHKSET